MKTKLSFLLLVSCFFCLVSLNAQVPQGFNYQAIARLTTGDPIINTTLPVRITIQSDSLGTSIIWQELHNSVTTNGFGLINLILGKGARQAASTVATFSAIDWTITPKFIKTEINYSGWKTMGVSRLWSVPYALRAKDSDQWMTSGANIYRASGNVGIGTTSPSRILDIITNNSNTQDMIIHIGENSNEGGYLGSFTPSDLKMAGGTDFVSGSWIARDISASSIRLLNGYTYFGNNTGLTVNNPFTPTVRMIVTPQGNVGIGTLSPLEKLHVDGNAYIQGSLAIGTTASVPGLDVRNDSRIGNNQFLTDAIELSYFGTGNRYAYIDFHGDDTYNDFGLRIDRGPGANGNSGIHHRGTGSLFLYTYEAAPITFYTANAQRMTIDAAGKVGIGTTSPTAKLEVNQVNPLAWGGNLKALRILSPDNAFYLDINTMIIAAGNTGYHFSPNGNTGLTISTPGYVGIGTSSPISLLNPYIAIGDALNSNAEIMDLTIKPTVNVDHLRFYGIRKVAGTSWSDVALRIQQRVDATDMGYIEFNPSTSGMDLAFGTSNIERLRINSAGNVGIGTTNPTSKFVVQPSSSWDDNTPLFEVRNKIGVPVFAVYNNGVRILVDHTLAKAVKGGFAVGGYDMTKAGKTVDFMTISPDSIRFNINNDNAGKGLKGGFAVGGYDVTSKGPINQDFMYITPQSATGNGYNTFMGYKAGFNNTLGTYNTFLGFQAGYNNSTGQYNVTIGYQSGYSTATNYNTLLGYQAGYNNSGGNKNTYLGYRAGGNGTTGSSNVCIGVDAGYNLSASNNVCIGNLAGQNTIGGANTYIGWGAGIGQASNSSYANVYIGVNSGMLSKGFTGITASAYDAILGVYIDWPATSGGSSNVCIGNYSGAAIQGTTNNLGNKNVCIGDRTGIHIFTGYNNTFIGSEAGRGVQTGSSNVFIGYRAGYNETGSSKLYISNTNTTAPLIYGDFGGEVVIDGNHSSNTLNRTFFVNGPAGGLYAWYNDSDEKLKRDIIAIPDALEKVLNLRGVNFFWKDPKKGMESLQMGFVGQEVAKVIPEVVSVENNHYSMQYAPVTALLVEAIKEQQLQIEYQQKEIDELKALVKSIIGNQTAQVKSF